MKLRYLPTLLLAAIAFIVPARSAELAAHKAFYDLEVARLDNASGFSSIDGKLAYELTGSSCDGYSVNYRIVNNYVQSEKGAQLVDTQLATFESGNGLEMNLSQKQYVNNALDSEESLNVKRPKAGLEAEGELTKPSEMKFKLGADVIYPSTHQIRLIDAAERGMTHDVSIVFDGSDSAKAFKAVTFIGKKHAPGSFKPDLTNPEARPLQGLASWPVSVSYYGMDEKAADTPAYQASFNMYENGISTDLMLDYGTYALKGTLTQLSVAAASTCKVK